MPEVDAKFALPVLAAVYDAVEDDRSDLDAYRRTAAELTARRVLDLGCGTGVLALLLAGDGLAVTGVDPAAASIDVARRKAGADRVHWILGDAAAAPDGPFDLVTMTGNAAMAVLDDEEWRRTLRRVRDVLDPTGTLVLETRDPTARAWESWRNEVGVPRRVDAAGLTTRLTAVRYGDPYVDFAEEFVFDGGPRSASSSRLRFRSTGELERDLGAAGLRVREVRDAPDRPGLELVVLAERA